MAIEVLDGGSDWCRNVRQKLEWKGLTTRDMGLVALQTTQNLLQPFNFNILNDFMKIEKILVKVFFFVKIGIIMSNPQLQPTCVGIFPVPALFEL